MHTDFEHLQLLIRRRSAQLVASWTLFADPVEKLAILDMPDAGMLQDHLICVSQEGTVGVISLAKMEQ